MLRPELPIPRTADWPTFTRKTARHPRVYIYSHPRMPPFRYPRVHLLRHPRVHPLRHPRMLLGGDLHKRLFRLSQSYQEIPAQRPG